MNERLDYLLEQYGSGEATEAELAELEGLLESDAGAREALVRMAMVESRLYAVVRAEKRKGLAWRRWRVVAGLAVAAVLALAVGLWVMGDGGKVEAGGPRLVAGRIAGVDGAVPMGKVLVVEGVEGAVVVLEDGSVVRLGGGAEVILREGEGARAEVGLRGGTGVFEVAKGVGGSFKVATPLGDVTALGTVFVTRVEADQGTLVVGVAEGRVRVETGSGEEGLRMVLGAGEMRAFGGKVLRVQGVVAEVGARRVAVMKGERGDVARYAVAGDAVVMADGKVTGLEAVAAGAQVVVLVDGGTGEAIGVAADGGVVSGVVEAVDVAGATVSIRRGREGRSVRVLKVAAGAEIRREGEVVGLGGLRVGETVEGRLTMDGKGVVGLRSGGENSELRIEK